jgi:hypothetical protein
VKPPTPKHRTLESFVAASGGASALENAAHPLSRRLRQPDTGPQREAAVFACRCGRTVHVDMMLDLEPGHVAADRRLTQAERTAAGFGEDRFRCDGCWTRATLTGAINPARFREATGQPPKGKGKLW